MAPSGRRRISIPPQRHLWGGVDINKRYSNVANVLGIADASTRLTINAKQLTYFFGQSYVFKN